MEERIRGEYMEESILSSMAALYYIAATNALAKKLHELLPKVNKIL